MKSLVILLSRKLCTGINVDSCRKQHGRKFLGHQYVHTPVTPSGIIVYINGLLYIVPGFLGLIVFYSVSGNIRHATLVAQ